MEILNNNKPKISKFSNNKGPVVTPEDIPVPVMTKEIITAPHVTPEDIASPKLASKVETNSSMAPDFKFTEEPMTGSVMTQNDTVIVSVGTSADDVESSHDESLVDNDQKNKIESGVFCNLCGQKFKNKKILKKHVKTKHLKLPNVCSKCSKVYPTEKTLHKHYVSVHVSHECPFCKHIFKSANVLRSHLSQCKVKKEISDADNHDKTEFKCSECKKGFKTDQALQVHVSKFHVQQMCQYCEKNFKNKEILRVHLYKCEAKKEAPSHDKGGEDIVAKEKQGTYEKICDLCNVKFHSKSGYYKHRNKIHVNNGDICAVSDVGQVIVIDTLVDTIQGEVPPNNGDIYVFDNV